MAGYTSGRSQPVFNQSPNSAPPQLQPQQPNQAAASSGGYSNNHHQPRAELQQNHHAEPPAFSPTGPPVLSGKLLYCNVVFGTILRKSINSAAVPVPPQHVTEKSALRTVQAGTSAYYGQHGYSNNTFPYNSMNASSAYLQGRETLKVSKNYCILIILLGTLVYLRLMFQK